MAFGQLRSKCSVLDGLYLRQLSTMTTLVRSSPELVILKHDYVAEPREDESVLNTRGHSLFLLKP